MYSTTRVFLRNEEGEKFFGEGPCRLLKGIERTGSLRAAAQEMSMAYTKALTLMRRAENILGFPLTERTIGGKGGGGSRLTPQAREFLRKYEAYRDACCQANREIYRRIFGEPDPKNPAPLTLGCVLMASGQGQRFGGNKLMIPFRGKPLILCALSATATPLLDRRIVVTRHTQVADLCRQEDIPVLLHGLPLRSDTVRLGLEALSTDPSAPKALDGCLFCACDQPMLSRESIERMIRTFAEHPDCICRLTYQGTPGSPILFPRRLFPELLTLPPGLGGSHLAGLHPESVRYVEAASPWELRDIDTKEDLSALEAESSRPN